MPLDQRPFSFDQSHHPVRDMCSLRHQRLLPAVGAFAIIIAGAAAAHGQTPGAPTTGMWITRAEIMSRPMSGAAWSRVAGDAQSSWPKPKISNQDNQGDVYALAGALYYARTGDSAMRQKVRNQVMAARGTERHGRVLALARNLVGYVLAADLIDLHSYSAADDKAFRSWLAGTLHEQLGQCASLVQCHETNPNNWGTHSGASRIAADIYLGDSGDLRRAATVFRGWVGDRSAYTGFQFDDLSWQCDPSAPVGIDPAGCLKKGRLLDGVLPDDQRRSGGFRWPPRKENYVYEALQGALVQAYLLSRQGYDAFNWQDKAIRRAYTWLYLVDLFPATGDDSWQIPLVNHVYGTHFLAVGSTSPGKNVGYTDWAFGG
jgi:hypothetical protein